MSPTRLARFRKAAIAIALTMLVWSVWAVKRRSAFQVVAEEDLAMPFGSVRLKTLQLKRRIGFSAYERGWRRDLIIRFQQLPSTNGFWSSLNEHQLALAREAEVKFEKEANWSWPELLDSIRHPSSWNSRLEKLETRYQLVSPQLVTWFSGTRENLWGLPTPRIAAPDAGGWRELRAEELLKPGLSWYTEVSRRATRILNSPDGTSDEDSHAPQGAAFNEPEEIFYGAWTFGTTGLCVYVFPGPSYFIDGGDPIILPYSQIIQLLDTNGPAQWLPCFPSQR